MVRGAFDDNINLVKSFGASETSLQSMVIPIIGAESCTVFGKLTSASSTKSVTITAQLGYGGNVFADAFTVATVTATTSGAAFSVKLERDKASNWDSNASDIVLIFTKTATIQVNVQAGVSVK